MTVFKGSFGLYPYSVLVTSTDQISGSERARNLEATVQGHDSLASDVVGRGWADVIYRGSAGDESRHPMRIGSVATIRSLIVERGSEYTVGLREGLIVGTLGDMLCSDTVEYVLDGQDPREQALVEALGFTVPLDGEEHTRDGGLILEATVGEVRDALARFLPPVSRLAMRPV